MKARKEKPALERVTVSRQPHLVNLDGMRFTKVEPSAFRQLARVAFGRIAYRMPKGQIDAIREIARDPLSGPRDRSVACMILENAAISGAGVFPICQDTGTACAYGWIGSEVLPRDERGASFDISRELSLGAAEAYAEHRLRASQLVPSSMTEERNSGNNLPCDLHLETIPGDRCVFLFYAKGGGSSNKTSFWQKTPGFLDPEKIDAFLKESVPALGVAACPPYRICFVVGGTSPESNLRALKLATLGAFEDFRSVETAASSPPGNPRAAGDAIAPSPGHALAEGLLRCVEWEDRIMEISRTSGYGAQLGGRHLAIDARAYRLPRHAASVFVSMGVSCCAHRQAWAVIGSDGISLETLAAPETAELPAPPDSFADAPLVDLSKPFAETLDRIRNLRAGTLLRVSGPIVAARDAAHARIAKELRSTGRTPEWIKDRVVCYVGPTEATPGEVTGSFGPTTALRMDEYLDEFMDAGISFLTLAKGNRSEAARAACARHGGAYLVTPGGVAALVAKEHVVSSKVIAYDDLGMEAVRLVELRELPVMVAIDSSGADYYATLRDARA